MNEPIEFFYFDLGNVIYHFDYQVSDAKAASLLGVTPAAVHRAIYDSGLEELYETGVLSSRRFVQECERCLGIVIEENEFLDATSAMFTFNQEILQILQLLTEQQISVGLLSNTCPSHWHWILQQADIDFHKFAAVVLSFEVGCMKPSPAIYARSEKLACTQPHRIAFIDDREANITAATQRGWQTLLYRDVPSTLRWLRERLSQV